MNDGGVKRYLRMEIKFPPHALRRSDYDLEEPPLPQFSPPNLTTISGADPAERLPPVGRCIYCRATEFEIGSKRRLSDEHIVSEGLGSRLILREASCNHCAEKTKAIEGAILRTLLWAPRRQLKLRGKRRLRIENDYPVTAIVAGKDVVVRLPLDVHPTCLLMVKLNAPRLLLPARTYSSIQGAWALELNDFNEMVRRGMPHFTSPPLDTLKFCQLLAKIAHGYAVSIFGLDNFHPLLPEFILREFASNETWPDSFNFVGGDPTEYGPSDALHVLGWGVAPTNGMDYLVVAIRLFAALGAPVYNVVVGTPASSLKITVSA